jgi:cytosine/adenosine deaminase-related metal-dependent hydrolase
MQYLSADCIIPIVGEPCYNSVLVLDDSGIVEGILSKEKLKQLPSEIKHFNGILCPGFVNTHCHLELSYAEGLISEGKGLDAFVRQLERERKTASRLYILEAIENATLEMEQSGIVATADIVNGKSTLDLKNKSPHYFHTFVEVFGSNPGIAVAIFEKAIKLKKQFEAETMFGNASIVPHATYSLSDELFSLIAHQVKENLLSIHHQENDDENSFFKDGSGAIAARRKAFNPDLPKYTGTGKRPMESIATYFDQNGKLLLVHNTVSEQHDIDFVNKYFSRVYWCFCPNANLYIEKRLPNINLFRTNNCKITLGTDSMASNHQLSIFEEIKTIQHRHPTIQLTELLRWGTLNGAEFIDMQHKLGSFEQGKSPGVVLIENIDLPLMKLKPDSTSRLLIPANYESNT